MNIQYVAITIILLICLAEWILLKDRAEAFHLGPDRLEGRPDFVCTFEIASFFGPATVTIQHKGMLFITSQNPFVIRVNQTVFHSINRGESQNMRWHEVRIQLAQSVIQTLQAKGALSFVFYTQDPWKTIKDDDTIPEVTIHQFGLVKGLECFIGAAILTYIMWTYLL